MENHKRKLITHNGSIHADDLFAAATLVLVMERQDTPYEIIRTRDLEVIKSADYVFDVGGVYDPNTNRYDHHQRGRAGKRENGISYASFGLVWKHFGLDLCDGDVDAFNMIDNRVAAPIDAIDNGEDICKPIYKDVFPYTADSMFLINTPTWKEDQNLVDSIFKEEVAKVATLLKREIKVAKDNSEGVRNITNSYLSSEDKRIVEIGDTYPRYLYQSVISSFPEPIYMVFKSGHDDSWKVEAVSKGGGSLVSRKPFPKSWCGFINKDPKAEKVTGIKGIIFVHDSGFYAHLDTRDNAFKFAYKALSMKEGFTFKNLFKN